MKKTLSFLCVMLLIGAAGCFVLLHYYILPSPAGEGAQGSAPSSGYVVNTSSKIFHLPSCPSTQQMKESNKLFSAESRESLIAQGLKPCGSCEP